jgi:succinate dehydrogenase/fumarate reductase flavoprotein subunit
MEKIGVGFARRHGRHAQRHLAGSRYPRSVYSPEGLGPSGIRRMDARCRELGVRVHQGGKALALLRDDDEVAGALAVQRRSGDLLSVAPELSCWPWGMGQLYEDSTYPRT